MITLNLTRAAAVAALLLGAPLAAADSAMRLEMTAEHVDFVVAADGRLAGRYHYSDPFKPFIHPLNSPLGHGVTVARPHDHRHHKGLMYALRTPDLNFWEEVSTLPGEAVGRERHVAFSEVRVTGGEVGFTETLAWEPAAGGDAVFHETRRVSCRYSGAAFVWIWETSLQVRRDTRLVQSQWSRLSPDGRKINYHGLGVRLCREFGGGTRNNALQIDDGPVQWNRNSKPFDFATAMGLTPARVAFIGHVDGTWPVPRVAVTLAQAQKNGLFILEEPFAFMALGPSNLAERTLAAGTVLRERYTVTIEDLRTSETK
jgi:hypothetical protein